MIPELNLDNQNVKDIFDSMLLNMAKYYSGDMDISYQEPGVALLELFCLLKDMQQYYLNFVSDKHKFGYAKLLGAGEADAAAAETTLVFTGSGRLPKGFPSFAGEIRFETAEEICLSENEISAVALQTSERISAIQIWTQTFFPFSQQPEAGNSLFIGFKRNLRKYPIGNIFFQLEKSMPGLSVALGEVQIYFYSEREKWEALYFEDKTKCFSISGKINISIPRPMEKTIIDGRELYWLRITLIKNDFELPPKVAGIYLNSVSAKQVHTLAESREGLLAEDGTLSLETYLEQNGVLELQQLGIDGSYTKFMEYMRISPQAVKIAEKYRSSKFLILSWDKGFDTNIGRLNTTPRQKLFCIVAQSVQKLQIQRSEFIEEIWNKGNIGSGPLEKCFFTENEYICFGNDENGAIPPPGNVRIIDCAVTKGAKGNVMEGAVNENLNEGLIVININRASRGCSTFSANEALNTAKKNLDLPGRAITLQDYRQILLNMPNLSIEQAKAVYDGEKIILYVKPESIRRLPVLNEAYIKNIKEYIEPFRILTTNVEIRTPEYIGVKVFGNFVTDKSVKNATNEIIETINTIIPEKPLGFCESLSHGALYGLIISLPFVKRIERLWLECHGKTIKSGSCKISEGGIIYLAGTKITITAE